MIVGGDGDGGGGDGDGGGGGDGEGGEGQGTSRVAGALYPGQTELHPYGAQVQVPVQLLLIRLPEQL